MLAAPLLMGGACEKKTNKPNDTGAMNALDQASTAPVPNGPPDTTPLAGVEIGKLEGDKTQLFYKLVGSLKSPCGKAHSLRTSFTSDTSCKRASYAVQYVVALLEDEAGEKIVREEYAKKYEKTVTPVKLEVSRAPRHGNDDSRIKLIEFFDYECGHCQQFKSVLEKVLADKGEQVTAYFMMFPIESNHPNARGAAQAAIAANQQGKFKEMHDKLFELTPKISRDQITSIAKGIGLDMAKFEKDYAEASSQVTSDQKQGDTAGVESTPTLFLNDRKYEGPLFARYIEMWIDEELAVNR
ncbi:MAG: thioredoxin domain-containing protein [Myxococcales bacterium]|nr:thioredoxin domain-containing protein [Myxococcales bacterium]